ncbi:MAG: hypothetical protein JXQ96_09745 [Cyclobacteriaceae bacterium]
MFESLSFFGDKKARKVGEIIERSKVLISGILAEEEKKQKTKQKEK